MDTNVLAQSDTLMSLLTQVVLVVVPIFLTWFARNFVKTNEQQKELGIIARLANAGIDYAEDVDKRGEVQGFYDLLKLSPAARVETSKGLQKLQLAGNWLVAELEKRGIKTTEQDAQKWVAAEFQNRIGSVSVVRPAAEISKDVANLIDELDRKGLIQLPANLAQVNDLTLSLANWIVDRVGDSSPEKRELQRQEAVTTLRSKIEEKAALSAPGGGSADDQKLRDLTSAAVAYVQQIKTQYTLTMPERDVAAAWLLTEITKQGAQGHAGRTGQGGGCGLSLIPKFCAN